MRPNGIPIPWQLKMAAKIVLSRLPVDYQTWSKLRLFRHGLMDDPSYALETFRKHYDRSGLSAGFVMLELGPGDSLASAVIAKAMGGSKSFLVDARPFATKDLSRYTNLGSLLRAQGFAVPDLKSVADILAYADCEYLTEGLASLRKIPTGSVDFCFSHAVLEHLPKSEFLAIMRELRRIQKPGGVSSHSVDLKDHLGGALNNLRFSEDWWEGRLLSRSGFYTNRIRFAQMLDLFRQAGFSVEVLATQSWNAPPIRRAQLDQAFQALSDSDLCVQDFDVLLR